MPLPGLQFLILYGPLATGALSYFSLVSLPGGTAPMLGMATANGTSARGWSKWKTTVFSSGVSSTDFGRCLPLYGPSGSALRYFWPSPESHCCRYVGPLVSNDA